MRQSRLQNQQVLAGIECIGCAGHRLYSNRNAVHIFARIDLHPRCVRGHRSSLTRGVAQNDRPLALGKSGVGMVNLSSSHEGSASEIEVSFDLGNVCGNEVLVDNGHALSGNLQGALIDCGSARAQIGVCRHPVGCFFRSHIRGAQSYFQAALSIQMEMSASVQCPRIGIAGSDKSRQHNGCGAAFDDLPVHPCHEAVQSRARCKVVYGDAYARSLPGIFAFFNAIGPGGECFP